MSPTDPESVLGLALEDAIGEALRILAAADRTGLPLRVLGGVAVHIRVAEKAPPALTRVAADLDFAAHSHDSKKVAALFGEVGYSSNRNFNATNSWRRLMFYGPDERKVDVFLGSFSMCHTVPLKDRLIIDRWTIPLAELLLTKLQIVEQNEKDVRDVLAILLAYDVTDRDGDFVNAARIAELCAADWGLWRTVTANLSDLRSHVGGYGLDAAEEATVSSRIDALLQRIDTQPKTRAWRLRAKIGDRLNWYELPDEVGG